MCQSLFALLSRTLVTDLHAKNQHNICKGIETSILKVLHGNTKSPRLKVKLCLFVLDRPTHNLPPRLKKLYSIFVGKNIFIV